MARDWESTFRDWAKPSTDAEQTKQENAERMIRDAFRDSPRLKNNEIVVRAQGSYRNNTNVRLESDVDIYVMLKDVFFSDFAFANGFGRDEAGVTNADYTFSQYKNDVEVALVAKFGRAAVVRGNKAFDIHENSYRVDADVVACFEHRRYIRRASNGEYVYEPGTEFIADDGTRITNWPEQQYENGVSRNTATGGRFKAMVRVIKNLRNEMAENGIRAANPIPSFLIECLVWNAPNEAVGHDPYREDVRAVLAHTFNDTIADESYGEWGEVNELKYLFRKSQPWTRQQAHGFLGAAWNYAGLE